MRSGIIAKKLGMTRVFTDAGDHVPVTVLSSSRAVRSSRIARRRRTATPRCSSASASAKVKNVSKAERGRFAVAQVEPKLQLAEFRVAEDQMIPVGAEITADHFVGRPIRRRHRRDDRQGFRRRR